MKKTYAHKRYSDETVKEVKRLFAVAAQKWAVRRAIGVVAYELGMDYKDVASCVATRAKVVSPEPKDVQLLLF